MDALKEAGLELDLVIGGLVKQGYRNGNKGGPGQVESGGLVFEELGKLGRHDNVDGRAINLHVSTPPRTIGKRGGGSGRA